MPAFGLLFSQQEHNSAAQAAQAPHAIGNGTTTRSPTLSRSGSTRSPTSTISPMNSWPSTSPLHRGHIPVEQVQVRPADRRRGDPHDGVAPVQHARIGDVTNFDLVLADPAARL